MGLGLIQMRLSGQPDPGPASGSLASRIAHRLFGEIVERCDYGIDLHSAAAGRTNFPNVRGDLADPAVSGFVRTLQLLARRLLAEVDQVARQYVEDRDGLEPVTLRELRRLVRHGEVTLLDVRPGDEFRAGHIPGAVSVPLNELERLLERLPRDQEIVAYCRGPYCLFAVEAVEILRAHGYRATRLDDSLSDWRARGLPVAAGPSAPVER